MVRLGIEAHHPQYSRQSIQTRRRLPAAQAQNRTDPRTAPVAGFERCRGSRLSCRNRLRPANHPRPFM